MCGLPVFPPKPKLENPARPRRAFRWMATWVRGAKRSNRISMEAHADRPGVRGEPLFEYAPAERAGLFLKAGEPQ
jgi:hypothetical protein